MLTIVDYGAGNIFSIQNMLKKIGVASVTASNELAIEKADKIILPGVGAFDTCAERLRQSGLNNILHKKVLEQHTPVLGICVGMQLMTAGSEEGVLPGLGWIKGKTVRFDAEQMPAGYKIPHMGWAGVQQHKRSGLFDGMFEDPRFYFVHSYYVLPEDKNDVVAFAEHGQKFAVSLERNNIMAVQFHPEKSHRYGMKLLQNFVNNY